MKFAYAPEMRESFPSLATRVLRVEGVDALADPTPCAGALWESAARRLQTGQEGGFAEIVAWRQAFSRMGLKPSQYRCASEALLRRFRKEGRLPAIHPLVDLCNAVSMASAIPIAVFDLARIVGDLQVRLARGDEIYQAFDGSTEQPQTGEVIFADAAGQAHARRWCNRQSALSAVRASSGTALIVAEALHARAAQDLAHLAELLTGALAASWPLARITELEAA